MVNLRVLWLCSDMEACRRAFWIGAVTVQRPISPLVQTVCWFRPKRSCKLVGYGSIPINTIFRGMNIHLPAILMFTRGTRFWHTAKPSERSIWYWHHMTPVLRQDAVPRWFVSIRCLAFGGILRVAMVKILTLVYLQLSPFISYNRL